MIKPFLDNLPRDQLGEIELASSVSGLRSRGYVARILDPELTISTLKKIQIGYGSFSSLKSTRYSTSVAL